MLLDEREVAVSGLADRLDAFAFRLGEHGRVGAALVEHGAPSDGTTATLPAGFGPHARPVTGRFVYMWNNICRLVTEDGAVVCSSFPRR